MQVWAVAMMRDEEDVARQVVEHLDQEGVDGIIVADNLSTDGTRDALASADVSCQLVVLDDPDPAYTQSHKMSFLARQAADRGADWVVPFDADEVWVAHQGHLAEVLRRLPLAVDVVSAVLRNHYCTSADDLSDPNPFTRLRHRAAEPNPMPKVAIRWRPDAVIAQGNHSVSWAGTQTIRHGDLEAHHFPVRSGDHLIRKARNGAAAYRASELPETDGAHWRGWGAILDQDGPQALLDVFAEHYHYDPADLVEDPAPWKRWS